MGLEAQRLQLTGERRTASPQLLGAARRRLHRECGSVLGPQDASARRHFEVLGELPLHRRELSAEVQHQGPLLRQRNDRLLPLWRASGAIYPSIYLVANFSNASLAQLASTKL